MLYLIFEIEINFIKNKKGNKNECNYIKEYRYVVAENASEEIRKFLKEIRKGLQNINEENVIK